MAICCWSLTGLPFTVGFFGKFFLICPRVSPRPGAADCARMIWLVVLLVINAAISAAYYLRIAAMFLRPEPAPLPASSALVSREIPVSIGRPWPVIAGIYLSVLGTLVLGISLPTVGRLSDRAMLAQIEQPPRVHREHRKAVTAQAQVDFGPSNLDR